MEFNITTREIRIFRLKPGSNIKITTYKKANGTTSMHKSEEYKTDQIVKVIKNYKDYILVEHKSGYKEALFKIDLLVGNIEYKEV